MTDTAPEMARRTPHIRIESNGRAEGPGDTRVFVDGVDLSRFITDVTWQIGAHRDRRIATATVEFLDGVELRTSAMPSAETALILKELRPEILRRQAAFLTRDGAWRVACTDSESADGVLPRCDSPDHPADDRDRQWGVYDCCDTGLIEMRSESAAAFYVDALTMLPALLDEREQLTARIRRDAEDFAERARAEAEALNGAYRERAHLVALLAAQYPAQFRADPNNLDYSIVYIQLPTGQASWHIHDRDHDLFENVTFGTDAEWDGHTTEQKYERINELRRRTANERAEHPMLVAQAGDDTPPRPVTMRELADPDAEETAR